MQPANVGVDPRILQLWAEMEEKIELNAGFS